MRARAGRRWTWLFSPPPGQKLDDRYGPSVHLTVSATPPELLEEGAGSAAAPSRLVRLSGDVRSGVLHVSARAASCDDGDAEFPACHVHQQDWGVPIEISDAWRDRAHPAARRPLTGQQARSWDPMRPWPQHLTEC